VTIRPKYACRRCDAGISQAETSHWLIEGGLPTEGFLATKGEIDAMLERQTALSADHFDAHPDKINWGHVGSLNQCAGLLRQISDSAFREGEHTE
jgi:hypothetical protein